MNVTEAAMNKNEGEGFRLKNLDANLLQPIKTNRRSTEKETGEFLAKSSTRRSIVIPSQDDPVDLRKLVELCDEFKTENESGTDLKDLLTQVEETEAQLQYLLS